MGWSGGGEKATPADTGRTRFPAGRGPHETGTHPARHARRGDTQRHAGYTLGTLLGPITHPRGAAGQQQQQQRWQQQPAGPGRMAQRSTCLCCLLVLDKSQHTWLESESSYVAGAGLEFLAGLHPQLPECWDYSNSNIPPHPAGFFLLFTSPVLSPLFLLFSSTSPSPCSLS